MITIKNRDTGRVIRASRHQLGVLGPNWYEVRAKPKTEDKTMMQEYLKAKGHKGVHLLKDETLKQRYEDQIKEDRGSS